ncbi:ATP-dependent RNA helicase DHX30 [Genypterus blacodes]|uniref:ATP-dependent RNA helicase DHX30 n=1 Tax=Genypterus blacodes TaxID=154954 RepID=UPI003F7704CA
MALPGVLLMRLRGLCSFGKCVHAGGKASSNCGKDMRWYRTKAGICQEPRTSSFHHKQGSPHLLKEFPDPKVLLNNTICRSLGVSDPSQLIQYSCEDEAGVKRATVTLSWPCKIEEEAFASNRTDAERFAAAAACLKLKELGIIGPNNQPRRRGREALPASLLYDAEDDLQRDDIHLSRTRAEKDKAALSHVEGLAQSSEALSLFPQAKSLLTKVIQVATSAGRIRELIQYKTTGGKRKQCRLTLHWPEEMTFKATGSNRMAAEKSAAALACMKLKELELLDEHNQPLTHAKYHREQVRQADERERRPFRLDVPEFLEERMKEYLAQYPVATAVQKLWEEEEERGQQMVNQEEEEDGEEDLVTDAITGRPYRPLSEHQARQHGAYLQTEWERADPRLSTELPVDAHRQRVISAVQSSRVVVIAGETGCGKTTRIPRFLLEESVRGGEGAKCNVLVTQPRRISAVSVAQRVAQEMGPTLKRHVGYQVRLESRPPEDSGGALLFLTVGVLLRKLQSNPSLEGISHVVVDEVHERDINTDLLLALLRTTLKENPDLRVVLMSATGDNQRLAQYFGGCPIVKVPGFMHPVEVRYLEEVLREMGRRPPAPVTAKTDKNGIEEVTLDLDLVADSIEHIDRYGQPGAMLCFLPGWQDIKAVQEKLAAKPRFSSGSQRILPLHSSLSVADQQAVFQRPPEGSRKIVLATNIAETSITIDDIVHVVDVGTHKEHNYDARTKVSCLDTVWISQSNVTQRKGRAGRCQPGQAYHLFPRKQLESMSPFPIPEILRTPLESLVVQAKIHSPNCKAVDFLSQVLDSPEQKAVRDAVRNLQDIGVLDKTETLTPLGKRVACMSCDPRLGKVMVLGSIFRCALPMLSVAACLTRDPFYNSMQNRALVRKAKEALSGSSYSDYLVFSRAVLGWRKVQQERHRGDRQDYLEQYMLSGASLRFINGLVSQFSENLKDAELVSRASECQHQASLCNEHSNQDELLKAVLLAGLYPNLIQAKKGTVTKGGRFRPNEMRYNTPSGPVLLHRSSVNRDKNLLPSRWMTFFGAVKSNGSVFIRDSSAAHPLALLLFTDCNITEKVVGDRVQVAFSGHSLVRCEMPVKTWELLWEFRNSVQIMLYRHLNSLRSTAQSSLQDGKMISLLVELLNNTDSTPQKQNGLDSEVD